MTRFDLAAPLREDRPLCPDAAGEVWLSTDRLRTDSLTLASTLGPDALRKPRVVAVTDRYWMLATCLAVWARGGIVVLPPNHKPGTLRSVQRQSNAIAALTDEDVRQYLTEKPRSPGEDDFTPELASDTDIVIVYTSGSTGEHQACRKTAGQLLGEAYMLRDHFGFGPRQVVAATVPCHHIYGLLFSVLVPFLAGARFVRESLFHPVDVQRALARWQITDLATVPTHVQALVDAGLPSYEPLERVFSSGAVLDLALARRLAQASRARVIDVLGSTESGGIAYRNAEPGAPYAPFPGIDVATNDSGHLLLKSPFLPASSGWEAMNDRVRLVAGGFEHLGRTDGVLKLGGKRIAVQELEARARQLPGVTDAAVLVRSSTPLRGMEMWLAVAAAPGSWTSQSLRDRLTEYFDGVVLPRRFRIVERLPRDSLGKLQKQRLEALFDESKGAHTMQISSMEITEHRVEVAGGSEHLTLEVTIPRDSPFFQGHFPDFPVLPGVAQLSEVVLPALQRAWSELGALEEAVRLKYQRPIKPGAHLELLAHRSRGASLVHFELREGNHVASSGQLRFAVSTKTGLSP